MKRSTFQSSWGSAFAVALALGTATVLQAAELTFQVYNESAKSSLYSDLFYGWTEPDAGPWPNTSYSYGDYVTNFNDTVSHGGKYFTYGSWGGLTPGISMLFRPQNQGSRLVNPTFIGGPYGDLQDNFIYEGATSTINKPAELRFTPSPTTSVHIVSFDVGSFNNAARTVVNGTLALIQDYNTNTHYGTLLWYGGTSASGTGTGDVTYAVSAGSTHLHFDIPEIFAGHSTIGDRGHSVSFVFFNASQAGNLAFDNFRLIEEVPEPSAALLTAGGAAVVLYRLRRRC